MPAGKNPPRAAIPPTHGARYYSRGSAAKMPCFTHRFDKVEPPACRRGRARKASARRLTAHLSRSPSTKPHLGDPHLRVGLQEPGSIRAW